MHVYANNLMRHFNKNPDYRWWETGNRYNVIIIIINVITIKSLFYWFDQRHRCTPRVTGCPIHTGFSTNDDVITHEIMALNKKASNQMNHSIIILSGSDRLAVAYRLQPIGQHNKHKQNFFK